ncbi:MAG TPA: endonuclease/exonuclease/phosphatase family protein [Marmoricola sp.]|nr:endonuclease/exonuclease/phosphatase family protein [Marmoricola sp.]
MDAGTGAHGPQPPGHRGDRTALRPMRIALVLVVVAAVVAGGVAIAEHRAGARASASDLTARVDRSSAARSSSVLGRAPGLPPTPALLRPRHAPAISHRKLARYAQQIRREMRQHARRAKRAAALAPTSFVVATFNVLGAGHTAPGGNRTGWASGPQRMHGVVTKLREHQVSVAGLQEFQSPQFHTFESLAGGEYAVYPGLAAGHVAVQNSIVWRRADWTLVDQGLTPVPYFHGDRVPMPHVLLRNLHTGAEVWFANFHNPADAHGPAQRFRVAATRVEVGLFRTLLATGHPLVVTGDMNERAEYACRLTAGVALHSPDGAYRDASGCHTPAHMNVDWIFGSEKVDFTGFVSDHDRLVQRTSDHPMVLALATIG